MPKNPKRARRHKRQEGAVLVEGVIVAASLVCLFGCVLVVQLYCALSLQKLDESREDAWRQAMQGCGSDEPVLQDMAQELLHGEFPFPDGILPSLREAGRDYSVSGGLFDASGHKQMKFVCNPRPGKKKPLTDMVGWVLELFS